MKMNLSQIKRLFSQSVPLITLIVGLLVGTFLCGCAVLPSKAFVEGEQAAYEAITPVYKRYVANDDTLTQEEREGRLRTVRAWKFALDRHAKAVNGE